MKNNEQLPRLSRRDVIKWFAAAALASQVGPMLSFGESKTSIAKGYGSDPRVADIYKPGDFWPLTLSSAQRKVVTAMADLILPADEFGPAASDLRVPDFIDEWVSAPYPKQEESRKIILPGLKWMNSESRRRFKKSFPKLTEKQQKKICDVLCIPEQTDPKMIAAADFFHEFTGLCMGAYYGTPEGWKAIGYTGNTPLTSFDGPPQEVLDRVGVTQTVK